MTQNTPATNGTDHPASQQGGPPVHKEWALDSWRQYREVVAEIQQKYGSHDKGTGYAFSNEIAYRGQACAGWPLTTTLERLGVGDFSVLEYMRRARMHQKELESHSRSSWCDCSEEEILTELRRDQNALRYRPPCYSYLAYLRQHGFPSPLLDWSLSPFIAAFFAFREANPETASTVAVYAFVETPHGTKSNFDGATVITLVGPRVATHSRHFTQKAVYTWCVTPKTDSMDCDIRNHHDVLAHGRKDQDVLIRITLPAAEKKAALTDLEAHNINEYSMFGTEESLIRTLATRAFLLR